jgi:ABC-type Fe3+-hydroxamate transport system substrate-binding protein
MQRIVSLVPSQTELLHALGLDQQVVGITKFCVRPRAWFDTKPRVGGTKTIDFQKVTDLKPDLVLANREENVREQVEALAPHCRVWTSEVATLADALDMIRTVGQLTDTDAPAAELAARIGADFEQPMPHRGTAAYLIWRKPYMVAGGDTFIHDMLRYAGFDNVFSEKMRYPAVLPDELAAAKPDFLLLSSEPFPFKEKHVAELQALCPSAHIRLVDGELFSWYGSRLLHARAYFEGMV